MNPWLQDPGLVPGPYPVGTRVRFPWGKSMVEGTIVEDRGEIGAGGRRLYRVEFQLTHVEPREASVALEELELVALPPPEPKPPPRSPRKKPRKRKEA
jgi:hypothetical protein